MQARLLLENKIRASGDPKNALVLGIETETRRKLTTDMKNAQMNDAKGFSQLVENNTKTGNCLDTF